MNGLVRLILVLGALALAFAIGMVTAPEQRRNQITMTTHEDPRGSSAPATRSSSQSRRPEVVSRNAGVIRRSSMNDLEARLFHQALNEIFEEEERDEQWAAPVEDAIRHTVTPYQLAMLPYASDTRIECRTNVCQLSMNVPVEKQTEALTIIQGVPLGDRRGPSATESLDVPGHVRIALSATFADGRTGPREVQHDLETQFADRFPLGFAATRAYIDEHPEVLEPRSPDGGTP